MKPCSTFLCNCAETQFRPFLLCSDNQRSSLSIESAWAVRKRRAPTAPTYVESSVVPRPCGRKLNSVPLWVLDETLRISLRSRRFFLPWMTMCACATVLLLGELSANFIVLNLMGVVFLLEMDTMLYQFMLAPVAFKRIEGLVDQMKREGAHQVENEEWSEWPA
jgi:hypothetical protein